VSGNPAGGGGGSKEAAHGGSTHSSTHGSSSHRGGGRYDDPKSGSALTQPIVQRPREEAPLYVHASGALSDRTDRDGHARRQHELEHGPVRRATPGGREQARTTPAAAGPPNSHLTHLSELSQPLAVTGQGRSRTPASAIGGAIAALGGFRGSSTSNKPRR
jgi:hypothetical protein